jgi:SAM-dependent methyltransferase
MPRKIGKHEGRSLFGVDPQNYDRIRPPYPEQVYAFLLSTGAIRPRASTLEIGAGNGLATRRLLELGVNPLVVIEPDQRFAAMLTSMAKAYGAEFRCIEVPFEEAELPLSQYDLVAAATSFHWIQPSIGLAKVAAILKPGGHAALWWHVFGDVEREDPYHEATRSILQSLDTSPSGEPNAIPYAVDTAARILDFSSTGQFDAPRHIAHRWTLELNTEQVGALYATFSPISRLPQQQRKSILRRLMDVVENDFGGVVERNMISPVYVARRTDA